MGAGALEYYFRVKEMNSREVIALHVSGQVHDARIWSKVQTIRRCDVIRFSYL